MFPLFTESYFGNSASADVQNFSHFPMCHIGLCSDPQHIGSSELGSSRSLPPGMPITFHHLPVVFRKASQAQVGGLNANGTVTGVQHVQTIGRATIDSVRSNMGKYWNSVDAELPISSLVGASRPVPTSFGIRRRKRWIARHEPSESFGFSEATGPQKAPATKRVTIPEPTLVMPGTPSFVLHSSATVGDGAGKISHIDTNLSVMPRPVSAGAGRSTVPEYHGGAT